MHFILECYKYVQTVIGMGFSESIFVLSIILSTNVPSSINILCSRLKLRLTIANVFFLPHVYISLKHLLCGLA